MEELLGLPIIILIIVIAYYIKQRMRED